MKLKIIYVKILVLKWEKTKKWQKVFCGLQNEAIGGLQIGTGFRDFKLGQ